MKYSIEKHIDGFCIVRKNGQSVSTGAPHMKGTLYFKTRKQAKAFADLLDVDTFTLKEQWTPAHWALYDTIPAIVRDIDGDLFEIKWYSQASYDEMLWEIKHNILGEKFLDKFKAAYDSLVTEQKNLIYWAYEV